MKITSLSVNYMHRSPGRSPLLLIPLLLACFGLLPQARGDCQQGCDIVNNNTFLGDDALLNNSGVSNTAIGADALTKNLNASWNTAVGSGALLSNKFGDDNTAVGVTALERNTTGNGNTAVGRDALLLNTTASGNTATGSAALVFNRTGNFNVANGSGALSENKTGDKNTACGYRALNNNVIGSFNIALGFEAGVNLTAGNDNIDIGHPGVAGEAKTIRIGATQSAAFIAGISGATVPTGVAVIVDANGHLGTTTSSARFKHEIKPMDKASEAIHALQPVTFRYKHDLDPSGITQFGLVAEEVEKVNPDLVARDEQGRPYSVRYEAVNAMLLNEFLKEHRKVEELKATIVKQQKENQATAARQQKQIEALTAGLQKVSAQVEMSRPAPQVVLNNQ